MVEPRILFSKEYRLEVDIVKSILQLLLGYESRIFVFNRKKFESNPYFSPEESFALSSYGKSVEFSHLSNRSSSNLLFYFLQAGNACYFLRCFVRNVQSTDSPRSLEGFANSVMELLMQFQKKISSLEERSRSNNPHLSPVTMLLLNDILSSSFACLGRIQEIVKYCVPESFQQFSMDAIRIDHLLTKLYEMMETSATMESSIRKDNLDSMNVACDENVDLSSVDEHDQKEKNDVGGLENWSNYSICLKLFFGALFPYLHILDWWICDGHLKDRHQECFIRESGQDFVVDQNLVPCFFLPVAECVLKTGQTRRILKSLHSQGIFLSTQITDTKNEVSSVNSSEEIMCKLSEYFVQSMQGNSMSFNLFSNSLLMENSPRSEALIQKVERIQAFDYLSVTLSFSCTSKNIKALRNPPRIFIKENLCTITQYLSSQANAVLAHLFRQNLNILGHFRSLRAILLMEDEEVLHHFRQVLFSKVNEGDMSWTTSSYLKTLLYTSIQTGTSHRKLPDDELVELSNYLSIYVEERDGSLLPIDSIRALAFSYEPQWPINLVINKQSIGLYNKITCFLLEIKRVKSSLVKFKHEIRHRQGFNINVPQDKQKFLLPLAHMMHFVDSIHLYVLNQTVHRFWGKLESDINQADDYEKMRDYHLAYLEDISAFCFLVEKSSPVLKYIRQMLNSILEFIQQLEKLFVVIEDQCKKMEVHEAKEKKFLGIEGEGKEYLVSTSRTAEKFCSDHKYLIVLLTSLIRTGGAPHLQDVVLALNFNNYFEAPSLSY